jgi:hypothetical protein
MDHVLQKEKRNLGGYIEDILVILLLPEYQIVSLSVAPAVCYVCHLAVMFYLKIKFLIAICYR